MATFTTREASIPGSAICAFKLSDIKKSLLASYVDATGPAPWNSVLENPASCMTEARKNQYALKYIASNTPESQERPRAIDNEPLMTRTVFQSADDRDLMKRVEVQSYDWNKDYGLVVIGTTNSKIIRASLKLKGDKGSIVHRKRLQFLTEQSVHSDKYCTLGDGVLALAIDDLHQTVYASGTSCLTRIDATASCSAYGCRTACGSSADPSCYWNVNRDTCDVRTEYTVVEQTSAQTHEFFKACPTAAPTTTSTQSRTTRTQTTRRQVYVEPEKELKENPVAIAPDMSMSVATEPAESEEKSWMFTALILCVSLIVGLFLGVVVTVFCYKWRRNANGRKDSSNTAVEYDDGSKVHVTAPLAVMRDGKDRHCSVYENTIRLESTGSDSSRDSGIRLSGESGQEHHNSRVEHEYTGIHANTTGRIRPKNLELKRAHQQQYQTLNGSTHFGSMKYSTTARGASSRPLPSGQPTTPTSKSQTKLGINSLHYATMQPKFTRAQSCPNGAGPQKRPIMPVSSIKSS